MKKRVLRPWYWRSIDWISNRVFWLAVLPWTLPILGGLFISQHLPPNYDLNWILIGSGLILFATIPLGLNALRDRQIQGNEDQIDAQERQCLNLAADLLPSIPSGLSEALDERRKSLDWAIVQVTEALTKRIYSNTPNVRAVVFTLGMTNGGQAFVPSTHSGRGPSASTHLENTPRFDELMRLARSVSETKTGSEVHGKSYQSYVSASITRDETLYGVLSLDTPDDWLFTERDEKNFLVLARLLGAFYAAAQEPVKPVSLFGRALRAVRLASKGGNDDYSKLRTPRDAATG